MTNNDKQAIWQSIQDFSVMHEEPQFMLDLRQAGFETYEDLELPRIDKVKYHRWPLIDTTIDAGVQGEMLAEDFSQGAAKARLVQVGSQTLLEQVPQDLVDQGVIFTDIFSAMRDYPELVQANYFTKAIKADESKMTAHHAAFMNNGIFVYVPDNVQIDQPLEAKIFQDSRVKQGFNHHVLIVGGQNAHFSYVENYQTLGDEKNPASIMTEIIAADGAVIKYAAIDELGENTHAFFNRRGDFGRDAQIDWAIGMVNDGNIVGDFDTDLTGVGSHSEIKVVGLSAGRQVQAVNSRVTNYADHSIGHILQKGVILDRATLTFNGIGHIIKGAKGADAQQESRLLMFSDQARGDANPILLIDENDVTAGHAASVGRVDPDELYYLLSRGIPLKQAQRLVIRGFLGSVITAIPSKEMRDLLVDTIETKLMSLD